MLFDCIFLKRLCANVNMERSIKVLGLTTHRQLSGIKSDLTILKLIAPKCVKRDQKTLWTGFIPNDFHILTAGHLAWIFHVADPAVRFVKLFD